MIESLRVDVADTDEIVDRVTETVEDSERKLQQAQDAIADVSCTHMTELSLKIKFQFLI